MRLKSGDVIENGAHDLDRRKRLGAITLEEVDGGQVMKRHEVKAHKLKSR